MEQFHYQDGILHAESVDLIHVAKQFGTPCYVYSRAALEERWQALDQAFGDYPHTICYAVKANSNLAVLNVLARLGSGFDIVSEGELRRVMLAGGDPSKVVFSGVAKSQQELKFAIKNGVRSINVESAAELERVQDVAADLNMTAPIALRVNPDVDPQTHPYISTGLENAKFGIAMEQAFETYQRAARLPNVEIAGVACHIGSQITSTNPFTDAVSRVADLVSRLAEAGIDIEFIDLGGGLGIDYQGETPPSPQDYVSSLLQQLRNHGLSQPVIVEPGRSVAGNSGILLTRVEYLKANASKYFAIVDAGMNDLLRPSLYQAYHEIITVRESSQNAPQAYDVVGPVCESADVFGRDRTLAIEQGDLIAVMSSGAYSYVMSSNYNSRPRPPEIMVDGAEIHIVRRRETMHELTHAEAVLP